MVYASVVQSTSSTATSEADTHGLRKRELQDSLFCGLWILHFTSFTDTGLHSAVLLPACQLVDVKGPSPILGHPEASSESSAANVSRASVATGACLVHPRAARFQAFRDV